MLNYPIATKLKYLRRKRGLTQAELSDGICTQAMISNFEKGDSVPTSVVLYEIAKKLNIDINYFFEDEIAESEIRPATSDTFIPVKKMVEKLRMVHDYEAINYVVTSELEKNTVDHILDKQFLLWHKGISDYYLNKDLDCALNTLFQALHQKKEPIELNQHLSICNSIAILYFEENKYEESLNWYKENLALLVDKPITHDVKIKFYYGFARALCNLENYAEALTYAKKAFDLCLSFETLYLLGELLFLLGRISLLQKNYALSEQYLNHSKTIFLIEGKENYIQIINDLFKNLPK